MVKSKLILAAFFVLCSSPGWSAGFVFDDPDASSAEQQADAADTQEVTTSPNYAPVEPPKGSYSQIMEYDPQMATDLSQQPGETEQDYLKRSKDYYKQSVDGLSKKVNEFNAQMESLSVERVLGSTGVKK